VSGKYNVSGSLPEVLGRNYAVQMQHPAEHSEQSLLGPHSLGIHMDAELQSPLWFGHPKDSHPCERWSDDWPQVGAGHPEAEIPTDPIFAAPVLLTSLSVPALSRSLFPFI